MSPLRCRTHIVGLKLQRIARKGGIQHSCQKDRRQKTYRMLYLQLGFVVVQCRHAVQVGVDVLQCLYNTPGRGESGVGELPSQQTSLLMDRIRQARGAFVETGTGGLR